MKNVKKVFNYDLVRLFLLNSVSPYACMACIQVDLRVAKMYIPCT